MKTLAWEGIYVLQQNKVLEIKQRGNFPALLYVLSFISFRYQNDTKILPFILETIQKFRATGLVKRMEDDIFLFYWIFEVRTFKSIYFWLPS